MNDEIRYKAAAAVFALANRTESAGKKDSKAANGKPWEEMPFAANTRMHVGKLREAVAYYEIAESINRDAAGWGYPRAMLLESMGAWDEAIAAFQSVADTMYAQPGQAGAQRCEEKRGGGYHELAALGLPKEFLDAMQGLDADAYFAALAVEAEAGAEAKVDADIDAKRERVASKAKPKQKKGKSADADDDDSKRQQAAETALAFVNHLLDRDYRAARAMLHTADSGLSEEELQQGFEPLFEDEDFPESAVVFDVQTDMPQLEADDLAWVYVSINSENQEAVSMLVARAKKRLVVRGVEWGRP